MNSKTPADTYNVKYSKDNPFAGAIKLPKAGTFEFNIVAGANTTVALYDSLTATTPIATKNLYQSYDGSAESFYVKAKKQAPITLRSTLTALRNAHLNLMHCMPHPAMLRRPKTKSTLAQQRVVLIHIIRLLHLQLVISKFNFHTVRPETIQFTALS